MAITVHAVDVAHDREGALLELTGAIDCAPGALDPLDRALCELRAKGRTRVVLDLSGIRYVNSSGFGLLVKHAQALEELGGGLSLLGVTTKVRIVIEMLGLTSCFAVLCEHRPGAFERVA